MVPAIIAGAVAAGSIATSLYNSYQDRKAREQSRAALNAQLSEANNNYDQTIRDIEAYYKKRGGMGTAGDVTSYRDLMAKYNPNDYIVDVTDPNNQFNYKGTRDDFLNPYYNKIIQDTSDQVQHSAAGAGLGRGSAAAYMIAKEVAEKDNELFKEAQQEYKDDRNFEYNKYSDYIKQQQEALNQKRAAMDTKMTLQGNLANDYYSVMDAQQSDLLKAKQDKINTASQYAIAMAGL